MNLPEFLLITFLFTRSRRDKWINGVSHRLVQFLPCHFAVWLVFDGFANRFATRKVELIDREKRRNAYVT